MQAMVLQADARMSYAAAALRRAGFDLCAEPDLEQPGRAPLLVLGGVPCSADGKALRGSNLSAASLAARLLPGDFVFAGKINDEMQLLWREAGATVCDLLTIEELTLQNAQLTAEGALGMLICDQAASLKGLPVLVAGYGRIAKYLCGYLVMMGAQVTVAARKESARIQALQLGCERAIDFAEEQEISASFAGLVNTVPAPVLAHMLRAVEPGGFYLELASAPFGVTQASVEERGLIYLNGGRLPGRLCPRSAGELIAQTVLGLIEKGEQ